MSIEWRQSCLWLLWLLVLGCGPARAELTQLHQASWINADEGPSAVSLPWAWDQAKPGQSGSAHLVLTWDLPQPYSQPMALFASKLGNAFELRVNGWVLLRQGELDLPGSSDHGKLPQWVALPQELLQEHNLIEVHLRADAGRRAGLSSLWVGPYEEVRRVYEGQHWNRFTLTLLILSMSLGVGLLAFALSWTQRGLKHPQDVQNRFIFMAAGVAETSWSLRLADSVWVSPPLPWAVWSVISSLAYLAWIAGALVFCHHACDVRVRGLRGAAMVFVLMGVLSAGASRALAVTWPWTVWMGCTAAGLICYGLWFSVHLLRQPTPVRVLVSLAAVSNIGAGAWNWWVFRWQGDPTGAGSVQRYTSVLFTLVLLVIVLQRFRAASVGAYENINLLDQRIAQKEMELARIYESQEQSAREQERQKERLRIWRDLHDGLGAHLSSALRQVQTERIDRAVLAATLRDSLLQLKLSVDAANLPAGDLGVMLGNLRYRLSPAFEAAGLALDWEVQVLPPLPLLESPQALRELQFIVYEALSNVLQHAKARRLSVRAAPSVQGVSLVITDDGGGWSSARPPGRGMRSMQARAQALGVELSVTHVSGSASVSLLIPWG